MHGFLGPRVPVKPKNSFETQSVKFGGVCSFAHQNQCKMHASGPGNYAMFGSQLVCFAPVLVLMIKPMKYAWFFGP